MKKITMIMLSMLATTAMAQQQQQPIEQNQSPAASSKTATGSSQTTIVDVNGNLKIVKPEDVTQNPVKNPAPTTEQNVIPGNKEMTDRLPAPPAPGTTSAPDVTPPSTAPVTTPAEPAY